MEPNCFACRGVNQKCADERKYVRYGDDDNCLYYAMAKIDLARLSIGDFQSIKLREMLAEYLHSIDDKRSLEILT